MKSFEVNPANCTISVHKDNMNPHEVSRLILSLKNNLSILMLKKVDPIEVMNASLRFNREKNLVTFNLEWSGPETTFNLNQYKVDEVLPAQTVSLNEMQKLLYTKTLLQIIGAPNG